MELRRWAAKLVPAARVDDEQTAVGIRQHVGGMEIAILRNQEVLIAQLESSPARLQDVPGDLLKVEQRCEQVVLIACAEGAGVVARQTSRCGRT